MAGASYAAVGLGGLLAGRVWRPLIAWLRLDEDPYGEWAVGLREEARATHSALARILAEEARGSGAVEGGPSWRDAHRHYRLYVSAMREISVEAMPFPATSR